MQSYAGDNEMSYLFSYFAFSVNPNVGYEHLLNANASAPGKPLVTYSMIFSQGYRVSIEELPIPPNSLAALSSHSSLIYDNGNEIIWE